MTDYSFTYSYTRELIEYADEDQNSYFAYNINFDQRIDSTNKKVVLEREIQSKFPEKNFIFFAGYEDDPLKVKVIFENELNSEEITLLDITISNHKTNVPDKYGVWYQDQFVPDPAHPEQAYLFDTQEAAEQFIITDELVGAIVKGVVVL